MHFSKGGGGGYYYRLKSQLSSPVAMGSNGHLAFNSSMPATLPACIMVGNTVTASNKRSTSSSKPSAEDLQKLDDKWAERFSRLEAMLLAKTFTVPVEPVVKPAEVTTSQKPFFDPGAGTSSLATGSTGPSLVQATGETVDMMETATQPLEAPSAGTATQPVQAPGSVPDVQPSSEGDLSTDSGGDQQSVTGSLSEENYRYGLPIERQCEESKALWVGTRYQSLKLCPLLMTILLPVHEPISPGKYQ